MRIRDELGQRERYSLYRLDTLLPEAVQSRMSGCRPLIKGFFGVALIVGAVMSSASFAWRIVSTGPDVVR